MKNRFFYYQLLDEREEQLINKAGIESFHVFIGLILLSYLVAILAPALFNPDILLVTLLLGILFFFNRARQLGVTYYSRFHFTIISFGYPFIRNFILFQSCTTTWSDLL